MTTFSSWGIEGKGFAAESNSNQTVAPEKLILSSSANSTPLTAMSASRPRPIQHTSASSLDPAARRTAQWAHYGEPFLHTLLCLGIGAQPTAALCAPNLGDSITTLASQNVYAEIYAQKEDGAASNTLRAIASAIAESSELSFEDGRHSPLSMTLLEALRVHPENVLRCLAVIATQRTHATALEESLRWVGYCKEAGSVATRRNFLEKMLDDPRPRIREAATVGLSFILDPTSKIAVSVALAREANPHVKCSLTELLRELQGLPANGSLT